jgi:hypothetical protein
VVVEITSMKNPRGTMLFFVLLIGAVGSDLYCCALIRHRIGKRKRQTPNAKARALALCI